MWCDGDVLSRPSKRVKSARSWIAGWARLGSTSDLQRVKNEEPAARLAVRVDYEPSGFSRVHRHPAGAYVYVIDGSVMSGLGGRDRSAEGGRLGLRVARRAALGVTQCESGAAGELIAFFMLGEGEDPMVDGHD